MRTRAEGQRSDTMTMNKTLDNPIMPTIFRSFLGSVSLLAFGVLAMPGASFAQVAAPSSQAGMSSADAGRTLTDAMARLAKNPRDISALINAGEAALKLDDPRSAIGFFGRADDVSPNNGRVKAGLGRSMLAMGQTGDGLRLMEQAATLNYSDTALLLDRGLARDLSGNQAGAQRDYQEALQRDPQNDLARRRYAVSLGISGQLDQAEKTIEPLLHKSDRAAWRDRAFILAMNGRTAQAIDITGKTMPPALADAIKPYMERMAMLTPGQRAAAVHMGQFPAGLVNVRVASTAVPAPQVAPTTTADRKGRSSRQTRAERAAAAARPAAPVASARATQVATATPVPASVPPAVRPATPAPAPATAPARSAAVAVPARGVAGPVESAPARATAPASTAAPAQVSPATPVPAPAPQASPPVATARVDLRPATSVATTPRPVVEPSPAASAATVPSSTPAPQGPPASYAAAPAAPASPSPSPSPVAQPAAAPPPAVSTRSLAEIMAEINIPEAERQQQVAPVNLAEIAAIQEERRRKDAAEAKARKAAEAKEAAKRKAEAEAKAKADAEKKRLADNPARYWVQIGVGRDKGALAFTLKRMKKEHDALGKYDGWSADWGATNRLVVGPFPNLAKAKAVEADMKKAGSDAFVWRSTAGEEVDRIGG